MQTRNLLFASLLLCFSASSLSAQLPPVKTEPLHPTQSIQGSAGCSATEASSCAQAAAKITPIVMGESPLEENLRRLTDEIGGRVSGSPEMARAVDWAVAAFRAAGVDVHTEKYLLPTTWSEGATRLEMLGPVQFPVSLVSGGLSPATPPGGLEGTLIDMGDGTEAEFAHAGSAVKGALLIVHTEVSYTWQDLFREYLQPPPIIDRAVKAGAAAILWTSQRERKLLYRHTNSPDGKIEPIAQAVVAREDALRLQRVVAAFPGKVRVRLTMPNKIGGPADQFNVIGEIRGYEKPDEIVVLGAHLDSWELGTGALDNGCNAAMVIEAARAIKASGLLPRRTIRFILFSGEEQGLLGSWAYVQAHRVEMDKYRAAVIYDSGIGRVTGYSLGGRRDIEPAVREILRPLADWGVDHHTYDAEAGTDHLDFLLEGVPTLLANQEVANYLQNYHAASDTFDKVDIRELKLNTVLAAATSWGIADRPEPIGKRLSRAELEALLKETQLDEELKAFGMWASWQSGARGRKP
ncbi:MAG TPA: M20/M25/M40 family metallo-hydrolase [Candidatus Acidoferrum sp.]|nr:M20/M25/M40 family metallo-hydrolase [Candidatus Acidoferrum sp.]